MSTSTGRLGRIGLLALLGLSLAVLLIALGLGRYVQSPTLSDGASVPADLYSLYFSPASGFAGRSERLDYRQLQALEARVDTRLATVHTRRIGVGLQPDALYGQSAAFVAGGVLQALQLPVIGRLPDETNLQLALPGGGARELVLSKSLAERLFGSAELALGAAVLLPDLTGVREPKRVEFRVAAVVTSEFRGPIVEQPTDVWLPLSAWHSLLLPAHQVKDVMDMAPVLVLMQDARPRAALVELMDAALKQEAALQRFRSMPLQGIGPSPERRLALLDWSRTLQLSVVVLAGSLLLLYLSQTWLQLERARGDDFVRSALGEGMPRWWSRHLRTALADLLVLLAAALLLIAAVWALAPQVPDLPLRASVLRVVLDPYLLAAGGLVLVAARLLPLMLNLALGRVGMRHAQRARMRAGLDTTVVLAFAGATCFLGVAAAALSHSRADQFLQRDLGIAVERLWGAELGPISKEHGAEFMHHFDRRPIEPLLADPFPPGSTLALATSPLIGPSEMAMVQLEAGATQWRGAAALNEVSDNYLDVVGVRAEGRCSWIADLQEGEVLANRAFMERYAPGVDPTSILMGVSVMADGVLPIRTHICGVLPDIQFGDVRGEPTPMLYRRLDRIGGARAVVASGEAAPQALRDFRSRLEAVYPSLQAGTPEALSARIRDNLVHDIGMARLATLVSLAVFLLSVLLSAQVLLLAARMRLPQLAVRWALGAKRGALVRTLTGRSLVPLAMCFLALLLISVVTLSQLLPITRPEVLLRASMWGLLALATALALGLIPVFRFLRPLRLRAALAEGS